MTCRELTEFLDAYLEGRLPETQRAEFERHLAVCAACRTYLDGYRSTLKLARAARAADATNPNDAPPELVQAILAARKRAT